MAGLVEHDGDLRVGAFKHRGDFLKLAVEVLSVGLGEDGADNRGHHVLAAFRDDGEHGAHEVHPPSLPGRILEHRPDRLL
jgi:hypothetical protein